MNDSALVELVDVVTEDGVRLDGAFVAPAAGQVPRFVDACVTLHGVGASFYEPFFRNFATALAAHGIAVVRTNNRGHSLMNKGNRRRFLGAAFEDLADARLDIDAWLAFLSARGYRRVLLFGHSLGGVKTALYLSGASDARVAGAVLASPPRFSAARIATSDRAADFAAAIAAAQALVDAGRGDDVFRAAFPQPMFFGARAFLAKYDAGDDNNVLALVPKIRVPVLAFTGSTELPDPNFSDHVAAYADAQLTKSDLEHVIVEGGDHYYTNQQAFVTGRLLEWIDAQPV
jgi:pimeloyl-ACP methyl ester carboxylesterase